MEEQRQRLKITVSGRVQGVWFRKYTAEAARSFHLFGFVRNEPDGSVYLEAEGRSEDLERLLDWLWKGSPLSRVEGVSFELTEVAGFQKFEVRR